MLTNFHTHCNRCLHAYGTEEDYVQEAIRKGVDQLGFSDHGPFPDHDFGFRMPYDELDAYLAELDRLKESYKGQIQIFKGLEIEYLPFYRPYYQKLLNQKGLDYLALGQHFYRTGKGDVKNIFFAASTEDYVDYAVSVAEAIRTGLFRFVAHPDIPFANLFAWDDNCRKVCQIIIDAAAQQHTILELNANGLRREKKVYPDGQRCPYPYLRFWEMAREQDITVIVGSDCHTPGQVYDDTMETAVKLARAKDLRLTDSIF